MAYTLNVNNKTLNGINNKPIRNLIYKGTTYEIWSGEPEWNGYLTFSSEEPFDLQITTEAKYDGLLEFSTDTTTWNEVTKGTTISSVDNKIYLRGSGNTYCKSGSSGRGVFYFVGSNIKCEGNMNVLLDYNKVLINRQPTMANDCYKYAFTFCKNLIQAPSLPSTRLTKNCYYGMFQGCENLTQAPELPATTLASYCYYRMFNECSNLIKAPDILPATTLASYCYYGMFSWCAKLTEPPKLPATTLANYCYEYMFSRCSSLTKAPALPATSTRTYCYHAMFINCHNLTQVPSLPSVVFAGSCYYEMFKYCTGIRLSTIKSDEYQYEYRIPSGTNNGGELGTDSLTDMFASTGGEFTGTPEIDTIYYTSNEIV